MQENANLYQHQNYSGKGGVRLLDAVGITLRIQILHSKHDFVTLKSCESLAPLNMQ